MRTVRQERDVFTVIGVSGDSYTVADQPFNVTGGQSDLFACFDIHQRQRVYKRYRTPLADADAIATLDRITRTGREVVAAAERSDVLAGTARSSLNWPIDIIRDPMAVLGVVLPFIPAPFLRPDGQARTFDYLCVAAAAPPDTAFRVGVLIRVCDIFTLLEHDGLTHGDVSARNLVWRRDRPHAYLIDCDGMRPSSSPAGSGVGTEGWKDPRWVDGRIPAHDRYSDRFAIAVLIYRGLLLNPGAPSLIQGQWIKPAGLPQDLDPALRELFRRAFDDPFATDDRPTATEWLDTLKAVALTPDGSAYRADTLAAVDRYAEQFRGHVAPAPATPVPPPPPAYPHPPATPMPGYRAADRRSRPRCWRRR
jgi:hypothetical protein